jgi:hypothetical protein
MSEGRGRKRDGQEEGELDSKEGGLKEGVKV